MELQLRQVRSLVLRPTSLVGGLDGPLLVLACAGTALLYAGCFSTSTYLAPVALASIGGGLLASVCASRRLAASWSAAIALLGNIAYLAGYVLLPTWRSGWPTGATLTALGEGLVGGWLRLLTTSTPVDVTPTLLVFPVLLAWWCGWGAQQISARSRSVLLPVVPVLTVLVVALLYGAAGLRDRSWVATAWATAVALAVLVRANRLEPAASVDQDTVAATDARLGAQRRRAALAQLALGLPTALLAVVAAFAMSVAFPLARGADRFDPRTVVAQPFHVTTSITPLATIQGQLATTPARPLFAIKEVGPRIDRVRVAVLDSFDGFTWTAPRDTFVPAGHVLTSDNLVQNGVEATLTVRVTGTPPSPFLPVIGEPTGLRATGLGVSAVGSLAASSQPRPGLGYELTSLVRPADRLDSNSQVVASALVGYDEVLPTPPAALVQTTGRIVQNATTPYEKLRVLAAYLIALPNDPGARAGHSYGAITRMLVKAHPADEAAFAEQHAAAFVVRARILRIPARVAVGYRVDGPALAAGKEVQVTTADAHAWAEVPIVGYGWVPFETLNLTTKRVTAPSDPVIVAPKGSGDERGGVDGAGPGARGSRAGTAQLVGRSTLTGLLLLAVALLGYAVAVVGEKHRRRWSRRRRPGASQQVTGAWREAEDRLVEFGVRARRSWTAGDTARVALVELGQPAAAASALAILANQAWYGPEGSDTAGAERAWDLSRQLRRDLTASRRPPLRPIALIDPRPLIPAWLVTRGPRRR